MSENNYFAVLVADKFNEFELMMIDVMLKNDKTDDEIKQFRESDKCVEFISDFAKSFVKSLFEGLDECLREDDEFERADENALLEHLQSIYGVGISWMKQYRRKCFDICEGWHWYNKQNYETSNNLINGKHHTFYALHGIQSRALLVYAEIICLLENGYPGGAKSLFRTLYELWAVAEFLHHDTDEVADAFNKSRNNKLDNEKAHYKWASSSKRFEEKVAKGEAITINTIVQEAHNTFRKGREDDVSNSFLNKVYSFPNQIIHPSAKGVFRRLSYAPKGQEDGLVIGRADTGLSEPAINSTVYMYNITCLYLSMVKNVVSATGIQVLDYIASQKIIPFFRETEKREKEEYDK